jgi:hypothetical protein
MRWEERCTHARTETESLKKREVRPEHERGTVKVSKTHTDGKIKKPEIHDIYHRYHWIRYNFWYL